MWWMQFRRGVKWHRVLVDDDVETAGDLILCGKASWASGNAVRTGCGRSVFSRGKTLYGANFGKDTPLDTEQCRSCLRSREARRAG